MDWYYVRDEERVGPIDEAEFQALAERGAVNAATLVWNAGMTDWRRFGELGAPADPGIQTSCAECGQLFPPDEMVRFEDLWV